MSILTAIDTFFCQLEGKKSITQSKATTELAKKIPSKATIKLAKRMATEAREAQTTHLKSTKTSKSLGSILHRLFVSPEYKNVGLEGWKDDKEKFKLDLLNDIKNFLFTKWEKPWRPGLIFDENNKIISGYRNISGRVYKNSSNVISLAGKSGESPYFITIKKLAELGGKILDASKQVSIISYIPIYKEAKTLKGDKVVMKPDFMLPKFHPVINVDFVEGIKKPVFKQTDFKDLELNEYVENFIKLLVILKRIPKLHYDQADRAYYTHSELTWKGDSIHLAPIRQFKNIEGYYSVLFHEITHSTMNPERCGRGKHKNASLAYANEELVAEMGAMIICSELGLNYNRQNSLSYLKGWLSKAGKSNEDAMIEAYAYACDAADYLMKDINFEKLVPKTMVARAKEMEAEEAAPTKTEKYTPIYKIGDAVSMFDDEPTLKVIEVNTWADKAPTYDLVSECGKINRKNISETKISPAKVENEPTKSEPQSNYYLINEDNKTELHFEKDTYKALADEVKSDIKRYFLWSRFKGAWISKAKGEYSYSVKAIIEKLNLSFKGKEKKRSFTDELARKKERAEGKIDKFTKRSDNATKKAEQLQSEFNKLRKDWSWLTQPIIKGHRGSEAFGRSKQRVLNAYERGFEEYNKAMYYEHKKKLAEETLNDTNLKNINFIQNRIKDAKKSISKISKWVEEYQNELNKPDLNNERRVKLIEYIEEGLQKLQYNYDKLAYYSLAESNLVEHNKDGNTVFTRELIKELAKYLKNHLANVWKQTALATSSTSYITVRNGKGLPYDFRKSVALFIYPNETERIKDKGFSIGNIMPTYISLRPKDWDKWLKSNGYNFLETEPQKPKLKSDVNDLEFIFHTHERDSIEIFKDKNGLFYAKRIGLPAEKIDLDNAKSIAFDQLNREGLMPIGKPKEFYEARVLDKLKIKRIELHPDNKSKLSAKIDVVDMPLNNIYTDEKRFQNRSNSFSEDSKNRIINAVRNGTFDWAIFDPVLLWFDPIAKRNYVLSGHSRYAAFKELVKISNLPKVKNVFSKIPSRFFNGSEAEAIDIALNSNTLSTKETEVERAMYYAKQRNACELKKGLSGKTDCEKQVETSCKDAEGKNANYILNLSYLNPEGFLIDNLKRLGAEKDNDSTNLLRTIANWIGEARRNNPELSNSHETEIAQFLLNGGYGNKAGQFKNKAQFNERLDYSFNKWKAGGAILDKPLNLANTLNKSSFEREFDERLAKAKEAMDEAIQEHEEKYKKYLFAVMDGSITQPRMDELMKPIIAYVKKAKTDYERIKGQKDDVIKAASAQTSLWGINGTKNFGLNGLAKIKKAITQKLSGDLGEFLGEFDRNCYTIVLRGDKGAGKSRLLFQLINAFAHKKFRAAFLCLEMAKNSSVTMRYKKEYISRTNLKRIDITDIAPTYDELNQICKQYDVVAIDSWTKLKGFEQKDFDRLQKENPSTIIIAVFQSTTGKVVRGGNMPEYDAGTVIQVNEGGLAECEKNRYAATDKIFNVFDKKLQSSLEPEPLTNV